LQRNYQKPVHRREKSLTQATDRAYRIGQDKPVFVHKLLCQDTVEERIHKLQQDKAKLAAGLLADADITNKLDPAMVRALLEE
jgi:SNF2 family DNA or RNA helicase